MSNSDIDGDKTDWKIELARLRFEELFVSTLRAVVRGGNSNEANEALVAFVKHATETKVPIARVVDDAVRSLHERAFGSLLPADYDIDQQSVVQNSLTVVAELFATDNLASARLSKRQDGLERSIEMYVHRKERRSREYGHSYIERLLKEAGGGARTRVETSQDL